MIKILYANGCSMTEGSELGNVKFNYNEKEYGANTSRNHRGVTKEHAEHIETHSYPYLVKQGLGIEKHLNTAFGGSCNRRISRTSIMDISKLLKEYDPSEIFVLIGFSVMDRFEIFNRKEYVQVVPNGFKKDAYTHFRFSKDSIKHIHSRIDHDGEDLMELLTNHFMEILVLKSFLEKHKIKYAFSYGLQNNLYGEFPRNFVDHVCTFPDLQNLFSLVGYSNPEWIMYNADSSTLFSYIQHCGVNGFFHFVRDGGYPCGNGKHPLEEGHAKWAEYITNIIKQRKLME